MSIKLNRMLLSLLVSILFPFSTLAQETATSIETLPSQDERNTTPSFWEIDAHVEIRNTETRQNRPENKGQLELYEFGLGFRGQIQKELSYFIEGSAEQLNGESEFFLEQVYLNILPDNPWISFKAGQFFYPVGWLGDQDNWFISKPAYYDILFKGNKPLDTGALVELKPLSSNVVYATLSCYAGQVFRAEDGRQGSPEQRPCEASLRTESKYFQGFATYFEHDLAFYDPIKAQGIGFQTEFSPFSRWDFLKLGAMGEVWKITEEHTNAETNTDAWLVYPFISLDRFRFGWRGSETLRNFTLSNGINTHTLVKEDLFRAEAQILESLNLIYEDEFSRSNLTLEDRWALRLRADWSFK